MSSIVTSPIMSLGPALVVDDDAAMRQRLGGILVSVGVASGQIEFAGDIAQARFVFEASPFALALVDIGLPDGSGIALIEWMQQHASTTAALVISTFATQDLIVAALQAGAIGYLLKEREDAEIAASLRSIQAGGAPIDPFVARHILRVIAAPARAPASAQQPALTDGADALIEPLTPREEEILLLVAQGLISREIAERLSRSTLTVEGHVKNILRKLRVSTRTQAIYQARSLGLLQ